MQVSRKPYRTPELLVHGAWEDLTAAPAIPGTTDAAAFSIVISDRNLKEPVPSGGRQPYRSPELTRHGAWEEMTEAPALPGATDAAIFTSAVPSDQAVKEGFQPVDGSAVLAGLAAIPVTSWKYRFEPEGVRHIGPMAQDFRQAFGLGSSDRHINVVDGLGVAYAAIQSLTLTVRQQSEEIAELRRRLDSPRARD